MPLFKALFKFVVITLSLMAFFWLLTTYLNLETVQNIENLWLKIRWVFIITIVGFAVVVYFSWESLGEMFGRKYDYPDAVLLFKGLKNTIFTAFAVILVLGGML
ncbi:MAG: hypothetical protein GY787_22290 [Alteromonadales bacterium]|nr:hypothetical protein [Alteromonadales bacterium]MCP4987468.1 hypothetical protein [Colwellia sp.]